VLDRPHRRVLDRLRHADDAAAAVNTDPTERRDRLAQARASRANRDPHGVVGLIVICTGAAIFLCVFLFVFVLYETRLVRSNLLGLVMMPAAFFSWEVISQGRRMRVRGAEGILAEDERAPILYLRPFDADGQEIERAWSSRVRASPWEYYITHEQRLARTLRDVGPFVALGDPTEELPALGAARMYSADEGWQMEVEHVSARAGIVLLQAGESHGLGWEIRHVISLGAPERVILALPPAGKRERRRRHYDAFRLKYGALFPRGLPESIGPCQFTYFDADWTPRLLGQPGGSLPAGDMPRDLALRRLARAFKIMWGPRWARYTAYVTAVILAVDSVTWLTG
jgi:hypothetical protein